MESNAEFVRLPSKEHGDDDYPHNRVNIWRTAFQNLTEDAATLMNCICILSSEPIPQYLFKPINATIPVGLDFLEDADRVKNARDELVDASLVRINPETDCISAHPLLQDTYFQGMSTAARKVSVNNVLILLRCHFPAQDGTKHLFSQCSCCSALHHHVQALRDKMIALKHTQQMDDNYRRLYDGLNHDDIWYMIEMQQYVDAERLFLGRLETVEDGSISAARVHRNLLGLYERTGRSIRAKASACSEFEIVARHSQSVDNHVANSWSNMGYTMVSAFEASNAVSYLDKAISMAEDADESRRWQQFNIDRFLRNRGRANQQMRRFEDASQSEIIKSLKPK